MTRTILLVDDDAEVLRLLGSFFEKKGWTVQRAAEASGALELYERVVSVEHIEGGPEANGENGEGGENGEEPGGDGA